MEVESDVSSTGEDSIRSKASPLQSGSGKLVQCEGVNSSRFFSPVQRRILRGFFTPSGGQLTHRIELDEITRGINLIRHSVGNSNS